MIIEIFFNHGGIFDSSFPCVSHRIFCFVKTVYWGINSYLSLDFFEGNSQTSENANSEWVDDSLTSVAL